MHTHEHSREHSHPHTHEHTHEHSHEGEHSHTHGDDQSEVMALLKYMASHNYSHAAELKEMAERLRSDGRKSSADRVIQAAEYLTDAGAELDEAIKLFGGEE